MRVSVCITVFNEEDSIDKLLRSLLMQTKKPDEIVIVDAISNDKTVSIIKNYQKRFKNFVLIERKCSRAKGRNIAIKAAKNEVIAMTDSGCVVDKRWLQRISKPFEKGKTDIVAGFYIMTTQSAFQKAESVFLGVGDSQFDDKFLPSTRSIAFRKEAWKKIGGFPEHLIDTAEDTVFNIKAVKAGLLIKRVKQAVVYWETPVSIEDFYKKVHSYAKGDAESGIFWHPVKRFRTHNLKALFVLIRYVLGLGILMFSFINMHLLLLVVVLFFVYFAWSFSKVFKVTGSVKASFWGVLLQFTADAAVISGFLDGFVKKKLNIVRK